MDRMRFDQLMRAALKPKADPRRHPEAFYKGLRLCGVDGSLFSVTNTPIFGNPGGQQGSSTFGQITGAAVSANGVSTGGGSRVIRLGLKLSF